jgi:hypothetical protein
MHAVARINSFIDTKHSKTSRSMAWNLSATFQYNGLISGKLLHLGLCFKACMYIVSDIFNRCI